MRAEEIRQAFSVESLHDNWPRVIQLCCELADQVCYLESQVAELNMAKLSEGEDAE